MEYSFRIGQEIIALRTHSKNIFRKGDIVIVRNMKPAFCNCFQFAVDIGHSHPADDMHCAKCGVTFTNDDGIYWFANTNFAPLVSVKKSLRIMELEAMDV
ncbi:MAG: hypothetical protein WCP61_09900 [Chitinophagia bacterium]